MWGSWYSRRKLESVCVDMIEAEEIIGVDINGALEGISLDIIGIEKLLAWK